MCSSIGIGVTAVVRTDKPYISPVGHKEEVSPHTPGKAGNADEVRHMALWNTGILRSWRVLGVYCLELGEGQRGKYMVEGHTIWLEEGIVLLLCEDQPLSHS